MPGQSRGSTIGRTSADEHYHAATRTEAYERADKFSKKCMVARALGMSYGQLSEKEAIDKAFSWEKEGIKLFCQLPRPTADASEVGTYNCPVV